MAGTFAPLRSFDDLATKLNDVFKQNSTGSRDVIIFVHGCCTDFKGALSDGEIVSNKLTSSLPVIFYSYPTTLNGFQLPNFGFHFFSDETETVWSYPHLTELIHELFARRVANRIHLIAHSLGNRVLFPAIELLATKYPLDLTNDKGDKSIDQVVFLAPDIDLETFQEGATIVSRVATRVTLYRSRIDTVIGASQVLHEHTRVGFIDPKANEALDPSIVTINASTFFCPDSQNLDYVTGHFYWKASPIVLADVFGVLADEKVGGTHRSFLEDDGIKGATQYTFRVPHDAPDGSCVHLPLSIKAG